MTHKILLSLAVGALALTGTAQAQSSRDYISIVGSSTVYPFTMVLRVLSAQVLALTLVR